LFAPHKPIGQRWVAEEYCQQHHLGLVRVFADEARSGSTIVGRDGFDELIHYCRRAGFVALSCTWWDPKEAVP
jgi:hypothetical protein